MVKVQLKVFVPRTKVAITEYPFLTDKPVLFSPYFIQAVQDDKTNPHMAIMKKRLMHDVAMIKGSNAPEEVKNTQLKKLKSSFKTAAKTARMSSVVAEKRKETTEEHRGIKNHVEHYGEDQAEGGQDMIEMMANLKPHLKKRVKMPQGSDKALLLRLSEGVASHVQQRKRRFTSAKKMPLSIARPMP